MNQLTTGFLSKALRGESLPNGIHPILQVTGIKSISTEGQNPQPGKTKFKITMTDGRDTAIGMVATQLCDLIFNKTLTETSVIKLTGYTHTIIQNSSLFVIAALEILESSPVVHTTNYSSHGHYGNSNSPSKIANQSTYAYGSSSTSVNPYQQNHISPSKTANPLNNNPLGNVMSTSPNKAYGNAYSGMNINSPVKLSFNNQYNQSSNIAGYGAYGSLNSSSKPVIRNDANDLNIIPINAVNPYSNKWTIKARITSKSNIRSWSNAKGDGTLFSIDLLDNSGKEIRATFFKEACTKFFSILEEGKVYLFSSGRVKPVANKQYSSIKNDYELTFDERSDIRPVADDDDSIKAQQYNFVKISHISNIEPGQTIDVIGVVKSASEPTELVSAKLGGKTLIKRDVNIVDSTGAEIRLTLWGDRATASTPWDELPIIAVKGVKVGDFGGRSLSTLTNSGLSINPQIEEAYELYRWRSQFPGGIVPDDVSTSLSNGQIGGSNEPFDKRKTISGIKDDGLGLEKADYASIKATINYIKHDNDPWYTACTTPGCNKKVVENFGGGFRCEKCDKNMDNCIRRFILSLTLADHTGNAWFSIFNEEAEKLLGKSADDLYNMKVDGMNDNYEEIFAKANFKTFVVKARVKQENVNGDMRLKNTIVKLDNVDFVSESKQMIEAINKYN